MFSITYEPRTPRVVKVGLIVLQAVSVPYLIAVLLRQIVRRS
jgi:hypothetical protein